MPGIVQLKADFLFQGEFLVQLKGPGKLVNALFQFFYLQMRPTGGGKRIVDAWAEAVLLWHGYRGFLLMQS